MNQLCYVDTETTGLDYRVHQPYEVCTWLENEREPLTHSLPHNLDNADPVALEIGRYHERGFQPWTSITDETKRRAWRCRDALTRRLTGVTVVAANPAFDTGMLSGFLGKAPWHHRTINISDVAMTIFDWDRPKGMSEVQAAVRELGYDVPAPDHTAEGDVRALRASYEALRQIRRSA